MRDFGSGTEALETMALHAQDNRSHGKELEGWSVKIATLVSNVGSRIRATFWSGIVKKPLARIPATKAEPTPVPNMRLRTAEKFNEHVNPAWQKAYGAYLTDTKRQQASAETADPVIRMLYDTRFFFELLSKTLTMLVMERNENVLPKLRSIPNEPNLERVVHLEFVMKNAVFGTVVPNELEMLDIREILSNETVREKLLEKLGEKENARLKSLSAPKVLERQSPLFQALLYPARNIDGTENGIARSALDTVMQSALRYFPETLPGMQKPAETEEAREAESVPALRETVAEKANNVFVLPVAKRKREPTSEHCLHRSLPPASIARARQIYDQPWIPAKTGGRKHCASLTECYQILVENAGPNLVPHVTGIQKQENGTQKYRFGYVERAEYMSRLANKKSFGNMLLRIAKSPAMKGIREKYPSTRFASAIMLDMLSGEPVWNIEEEAMLSELLALPEFTTAFSQELTRLKANRTLGEFNVIKAEPTSAGAILSYLNEQLQSSRERSAA